MNFLWIATFVLPLLAALLLFVLPGQRQRIIAGLWVSCIPALLLALLPPPDLLLQQLWPGARLGGSDLMTRAWLGFTALLWGVAGVAASTELRNDERRLSFWLFWLLSLSGNLLLIIAQDALSFYVGFSVMSLSAYGLIIHHKGSQSRRAGRLYMQLAIIAEVLLLTGIIIRSYTAGGSAAFADWESTAADPFTVLLLLTGLGLKAGFWPLHMWLPLAHPVAPAPASAVLSGAMLKAGILGLWRFLPGGDPLLQSWSQVLLGLGLISAFYAVAVGLFSSRAKQALAYSSVSQMGYMLIIIALFWHQPAHESVLALLLVLYATHHALCKGALFLGSGIASRAGQSTRLNRLFWFILAVPAVALAGLPFTSGAAVKLLLKDSFKNISDWSILLSLGALATTLLILRAWFLMRASAREQTAAMPLRLRDLLPLAVLALLVLLLPLLWPDLRDVNLDNLTVVHLAESIWPLLIAGLLTAVMLYSQQSISLRLVLPDPLCLSLWLRRILLRPPLPRLVINVQIHKWRQFERLWNRFWQGETVRRSALMLVVFLLAAGVTLSFA
jgi:hydrogenase-4 component B